MNDNIPIKSRVLAVIGYINSAIAAAALVMAIFLLQKSSLFFSPGSIAEQETPVAVFQIATLEIANEYDLHRLLTTIRVVIVILYTASLLSYVLNTYLDSFTHLSVKTSSKYCRNIMILMLIHMVFNISGIIAILLYRFPKFIASLMSNAIILGNTICVCLAIAYFLNSIVAGIYAAKGQYFKSFLIYPVVKI